MIGCPGCGLFLGHAEGCRGVVATYYRYMSRYEEDGFMSVEEAEAFLRQGEDEGSLVSESVVLPDGTVARSRDALGILWP